MDDDASNLQPWVTATTISVTVLAFVSVCLRILARFERKQRLWWDDWMILFSMGWNLVVVGFIFAMIHQGMGIHANKIPPANVVLIAKYLVVAEILYVFNLVWTKLSILLMYYRIFHFAYFKRWAYIIGTFVLCWVICITFLFVFICVPVKKLWYPDIPGHCINQVGTWIANAASTILTDLAILFLPLPQVWKLQLRMSEKIALTFAFGLGFFVVFASAYRFSVLFSYTITDSSYTLAPTVGWTAIEMSAGIVSACLPTLRPALQLAARALHLQGKLPALLRTRTGVDKTTTTTDTTVAPLTGETTTTSTTVVVGSAGRGRAGSKPGRVYRHSFYHLPDEEELGRELRPGYDSGLVVTDVKGARGRGSFLEEVPMHGIRVKKDFTQDG